MGGTSGQPGDQVAPTGPSRDSWTPLNSRTGSPAASGPAGMGMRGMVPPGAGGGSKVPPMMAGKAPPGMVGGSRPGNMPPNMPPPGAGQAGGNADKENGPQRTEFIILFVWKEPTPSDDLRGQTAAAGTGGAAVTATSGAQAVPKFRPRRSRGRNRSKGG
jgi:hypothetical protein